MATFLMDGEKGRSQVPVMVGQGEDSLDLLVGEAGRPQADAQLGEADGAVLVRVDYSERLPYAVLQELGHRAVPARGGGAEQVDELGETDLPVTVLVRHGEADLDLLLGEADGAAALRLRRYPARGRWPIWRWGSCYQSLPGI